MIATDKALRALVVGWRRESSSLFDPAFDRWDVKNEMCRRIGRCADELQAVLQRQTKRKGKK